VKEYSKYRKAEGSNKCNATKRMDTWLDEEFENE
jgi:hypothetical protein